MDGSFDIYVHTPVQKVGGDKLRPEDRRDRFGVEEAKASLDKAYTWLEQRLRGPAWAAGEAFGLAGCAAATAPFYAAWVERIGPRFPTVQAYRAKLLARPSAARAVDEARPNRNYFPLAAPERD